VLRKLKAEKLPKNAWSIGKNTFPPEFVEMRVVNAQVGMKNLPLCERQRFLSNISRMALLKVVAGSGGHEKREWYEGPIWWKRGSSEYSPVLKSKKSLQTLPNRC